MINPKNKTTLTLEIYDLKSDTFMFLVYVVRFFFKVRVNILITRDLAYFYIKDRHFQLSITFVFYLQTPAAPIEGELFL